MAKGIDQTADTSLRKKELIETVVLRSGIKKKDAKPVVEAMLEILGEHVALAKDMNIQPFGKIMFQKQIDKSNAMVSVARIRQSKTQGKAPGKAASETPPNHPAPRAAE